MIALQSLQALQFQLQSTRQSVFWHVESVSGAGQLAPPLLAGVVTIYVLVLVPGLGAVSLIPSQVATQVLQLSQFPTQSTRQSVFWHVESVCGTGQLAPPLLAGVVTIYVLVLVPGIGAVALIPSQVAAQVFQLSQYPIQSTGQSIF